MIQTHIHYYKKGGLCGLCLDDMYKGYVGKYFLTLWISHPASINTFDVRG